MTISRLVRGGLGTCVIALAAALASCGDGTSPVSPPSGPAAVGLRNENLLGISLLACSPLPYDSATQAIGPDGGTINVGVYSLTVPQGALADTVSITAVAPSGNVNLVQFQPEGLQFAVPAQLSMSYANCGLLGSLMPKSIAHTTDALDILELVPSLDNVLTQTVTGRLKHFSDYAVAW